MCDAQYANMENKSSIHHEALTYINQIEALQNILTGYTFNSQRYDVMCVCLFIGCFVCECEYLWLLIRLLVVGCISLLYKQSKLGHAFRCLPKL